MGPGVEGDLLVLGGAEGHVDLHTVQVAKGRHGADLAIGEQVLELPLGSQAGLAAAGDLPQQRQVHPVGGRQDGLGQLLAGDVGRGGDLRGGEELGVGAGDVLDLLVVEGFFQLLGRRGGLLADWLCDADVKV